MKKVHETEKENQNYPSHGWQLHEQESSRDLWTVLHDWAACGLAFTLTSLCRFLLFLSFVNRMMFKNFPVNLLQCLVFKQRTLKGTE